MRKSCIRSATILVAGMLMLVTLACFNSGHTNTIVESRFEVATGSVVLGARQLLVDTSNGDVWMLEGDQSPSAQWVLLARGPEDARELTNEQTPPPAMGTSETQPEDD
jgi:hypothetical protein